MCASDRQRARPCGQVEAIAQIDDRSHHARPIWAPLRGPLVGANDIPLPEVDTLPQPIVKIPALHKRRTAQELLSGLFIAAVVSQNYRQTGSFPGPP